MKAWIFSFIIALGTSLFCIGIAVGVVQIITYLDSTEYGILGLYGILIFGLITGLVRYTVFDEI